VGEFLRERPAAPAPCGPAAGRDCPLRYLTLAPFPQPCSRLGLGSVAFQPAREDEWRRLLDAFVEHGGNCLDTARSYQNGESERVIGRWLQSRGIRERMILITKGCHPRADGLPRVRPEVIDQELPASLEALGVETIDLYFLHRDDENVPVEELVDCLNEHVRAGRIRAFGGSNWRAERLEAANAYARRRGLAGFAASSPHFSLAVPREPRWPGCRHLTDEERPWYVRTGMPVFAWSAQAGGFFTGRFQPDRLDQPDMVRTYYTEENWRRYHRARELARRRGVEPHQVALAYVLHQPFPTVALIGPVTVEELRSSLPGGDLELSAEEVAWLERG